VLRPDCAGARAAERDLLVLVPERREAETLARLLERLGHPVALYPEQWSAAAAGGRVVVGSRAAALATMRQLAGVLVLDAHSEAYVEQRSPNWDAQVLAGERAGRAGVPCILVSACPTLEQLDRAQLVELPRSAERAGWPPLEIVDRRTEDPRSGLYSPRLAPLLTAALEERPGLPAVCVLNRTGRVRLFACGSCGEIVRCEACGSAVVQRQRPAEGEATRLDCPRCAASHPAFCTICGSTKLRMLRAGVGRAAEELAALTGLPVAEVSGPGRVAAMPEPGTPVVVGTEAVLHRLRAASIVVFLDFDQELLAARYRAAEQALALLARAARLVGAARVPAGGAWPRGGQARADGRIAVQTRLAEHEVILAALHADPSIVSAAEAPKRKMFGLPPYRALATVSGDGAAELVGALPGDVEVAATGADRYLVRARDPNLLADALKATGLVGSGPRIVVDPAGA
jgi:primosomal protein N' (replication factor Y)